MPTFYIPQGVNEASPALAANQPHQGTFVDPVSGLVISAPTSDLPSIMQTWTILAFYLFVAAQASVAIQLAVMAQVSGYTIWSSQQGFNGVGDANTTFSDDLINPFDLGPGNRLTFGYQLTPAASLGSGWQIALSSMWDPVMNHFAPQQSPVRYEVAYNPALPGRARQQ